MTKLDEFLDQVMECERIIQEQKELRKDLQKRIDEELRKGESL